MIRKLTAAELAVELEHFKRHEEMAVKTGVSARFHLRGGGQHTSRSIRGGPAVRCLGTRQARNGKGPGPSKIN